METGSDLRFDSFKQAEHKFKGAAAAAPPNN